MTQPNMEEMHQEFMYVLVAPDGSPQVMTLAPEFSMCVAVAQMLADKGIGQNVAEMFKKGFQVLPVKVTITQNGTAEEGFQKAKSEL